MKAGFLNLFSRSLYRGGLSPLRDLDPESAEYKRIHEERERFAAAAIAFCLEHDGELLRHFWQAMCNERDESGRRDAAQVEVEPKRWADLLLKTKHMLCAIEMKIGARLKKHQNPACKAFSQRGGYGYLLSKECHRARCKGRYVVLGWKKPIELHRRKPACGLECEQRTWADLANGLPSTRLMADLTELLSSFGVWDFTFKEMKTKKLSGKLRDVGSAIAILESVRASLGWPPSLRVTARAEQHWELGIYLSPYSRKKPVPGLAQKLKKANRPEGAEVAWFGYVAEAVGSSEHRCVFVYCSMVTRKRLVRRLKQAGFMIDEEMERDSESGPCCAVVPGGRATLDDVQWFKTALEVAAGKPADA